MSTSSSRSSSTLLLVLLHQLLQLPLLHSLNSDGSLLLSFKYAVLDDPHSVLGDWNYNDATPCSWNGVVCMGIPASAGGGDANGTTMSTVISLVLPKAQLLGSITAELGLVEHLRHLDLSGNFLNGTLPATLFNASDLRILSLSDNEISGTLPEFDAGKMTSLQVLNLSDNALTGGIPIGLSLLPNLSVVALRNNYLYGNLPSGGFDKVQVMDLSSNLVNGTLPTVLGGGSLKYLNLSYNRLTGEIPGDLGSRIPSNATIDLSFNNFTGVIPETGAFVSQKPRSFAGNSALCGKPLKYLCPIPSTLSDPPPNVTAVPGSTSPPAFAAMPKNTDGNSGGRAGGGGGGGGGMRPVIVAAITVADLVGIGLLFIVFLYVYQAKKKKKQLQEQQQQLQQLQQQQRGTGLKVFEKRSREEWLSSSTSTVTTLGAAPSVSVLPWCFRKNANGGDDSEETSETTASSETEADDDEGKEAGSTKSSLQQKQQQRAMLVMVDGEMELELETLLKASAYILGATGSSIVYKAVLADGTALAVRRIGESTTIEKLKEFEAQVRSIARFRHPNLLRIRGFYWGADEKLLIYDYAPNGSLANISFSKKLGSSPCHLSWEARLRIARGVARGLAYLHEKKGVHGNVKPSNILLGADMEPIVADLGVERLMYGDGNKAGSSARHFGSKRSTCSLPELSPVAGASPSPSSSSAAFSPMLPYHAPESLKNLKPNARWDVYSFGIILLELIAGRTFPEAELCQWHAGFVIEERNRVLRMADPALRGEVGGKEEALLSCFKLAFSCASLVSQKRPSMKDALQILDKITSSSSSSSSII